MARIAVSPGQVSRWPDRYRTAAATGPAPQERWQAVAGTASPAESLRQDAAAGSGPGQEPQPGRPRVPGVDDRRAGDDVVQCPAPVAQQDAGEPQSQEQ